MRTSISSRFMFGTGGAPLTASKSGDASASTTSSSGQTLTTNAVTVTPNGGLGTMAYSWSRVTGSFAINSPTSATTSFTETLASGSADSGVGRCQITSGDGQIATVDVNVHLEVDAPSPPAWNVSNGANLGSWAHGGAAHSVPLYATGTSPPPDPIVYTVFSGFPWGAGNSGPEPDWPIGVATTGGSGNLTGAVSAGVAPGSYSATYGASNTADGSQSAITVTVTVT
jgi:hypothetical protein